MTRNPRRFSDHEVAEQKAEVLRGRMVGATFAAITEKLSAKTSDGAPLDIATVRRRYQAAVEEYEVPRAEWDAYRNTQLAEVRAATDKAMAGIIAWNPRNGEAKDVAPLMAALVRLQERADRVIGFPVEAPAPPPANADARAYVLNIVTNPVAHQAMLTSMRAIEAETIDAEVVDDGDL
jgi:hypothetical protein